MRKAALLAICAMVTMTANGQTVGSGGITQVPGIRVGHFTLPGGLTGCTVVLADGDGAVGGVAQRGGAPGTRETDLLDPLNLVERVNAIVLSGGSAFGLDAAQGVTKYLEEKNIGFKTSAGVVPIVPAAILFDLGFGGNKVTSRRRLRLQGRRRGNERSRGRGECRRRRRRNRREDRRWPHADEVGIGIGGDPPAQRSHRGGDCRGERRGRRHRSVRPARSSPARVTRAASWPMHGLSFARVRRRPRRGLAKTPPLASSPRMRS